MSVLTDVSLFQFPEETCVDDNDRELLAQRSLLINKLLPILHLYDPLVLTEYLMLVNALGCLLESGGLANSLQNS